jgi:CheY-like chemotaxis protein
LTLSILVFLVEDESLIQELVEHALEEGGFAVVAANSGHEAIAMLEVDGAEFDRWQRARMGLTRRAKQHTHREAVCSGANCDGSLTALERKRALRAEHRGSFPA